MDKSSRINLKNEPENLIELENLSLKNRDKNLEEIEEEEKEIKDNIIDVQKNETKNIKKEKKEKETKVNINLSVEDIYKIISRNGKLNNKKITLKILYLSFTILFLNTFFIMIIAFLRPSTKTNKFECYDIITKTYSKCLIKNKCKCKGYYCVEFCYEKDYMECNKIFNSIVNSENNSYSFINYNIIDISFIKYDIKENERKSLFQKIGKYYCYSLYFELSFIGLFILGSFIGYFVSAIFTEILGKKKIISFLGIGLCISNAGISILSYKWYLKDYFLIITILWSINFFFLGFFLFPFDSAIYIYTLELIPKTDFLKSINGLIYEKYFISLLIFYLFENFFKHYWYFFLLFEIYLIVFIICFILFYIETPRFFSERNDLFNKKLSIEQFLNGLVTFDLDSNENPKKFIKKINKIETNSIENQPKKLINMKIITHTYQRNIRIYKKIFMIQINFFSLNYCLYTILFSSIFDLMDPNSKIKEKTKLGYLFYLIVLFPLLQFPSYFCYELIDLDKFIMFFLFLLSFLPFNYDINKLKFDNDRNNLFYGIGVEEMEENSSYIHATSLWIITFIISIFNIMILLQASTLYRTYFYFKLQTINSFTVFFSFFSIYLTETPLILVSILSFFTFLIFTIMRIKWKFDPFEEEIDIENE